MATKVHMEALSPTMEEGQVVKWYKAEGDEISSGDVLADIETDKATMELTARGEGTLLKVLVEEGGTAPVGQVIAVIGEEGEDISELVEGAGEAPKPDEPAPQATVEGAREKQAAEATAEEAPAGEAVAAAAEAPAGREGAAEGEAPGAPGTPAEGVDGGRIKASPLARRLADEAGLDLASIEGSGPGGRVVKRDVEEARRAPRPEAPAAAAAGAPAGAPAEEGWRAAPVQVPEEEYEDVGISQMRKTIARRLVESIGPVPHFFLTVEVDMGRVMEARKRVNALLEARGQKVSVNDFVLKATAAALRQHPEVNAHWHTDHIRRYHAVHVGVAVAVDEGLITPVIRNADRKGMVQISAELRELAGRARERKLKPEEYTGATFSVSNLGMFGIQEFTAVINPPEGGILAVGKVEEIAVVVEGEVVARPRMKVTMSCDHRVIDGATGARFLQTLQTMLEEPAAVLL